MEYFPTTKKGERFDICLFRRKDWNSTLLVQ
jgi:hypothetical protein